VITHNGLLSIAFGGKFGGPYSNWWEFEKNATFDRELGGHEAWHMLSLSSPPSATDISPANSTNGFPQTTGHPSWTVYTIQTTPSPMFVNRDQTFATKLGQIDSSSNPIANITSLTLAAVQFSYLIPTADELTFRQPSGIGSLFHGWFSANQQSSAPAGAGIPQGFDHLNFAGAGPDIVFQTVVYSPGLEQIRDDDWNHEDLQINFFTIAGGGTLVSCLSIPR
jgi:hypothetical protein